MKNYIQWKPIFYFNETKNLENSKNTLQYDFKENETMPNGLYEIFFPKNTNVSFGLRGNEKNVYFYTQSNYSSWTFIAIGLGLSTFTMVAGLTVLICLKLRSPEYL